MVQKANLQKVCLIVIDGWGISNEENGNAIYHAKTPVMDRLCDGCLLLEASELHVGVPKGQMGNSEVGHLNIGAGRVVFQDITRINKVTEEKEFLKNHNFVKACERAKTISGGRIHLLGLVSDGGVHSHINHMFGLVEACKEFGIEKCFLHFFSDGRDTSPTSGAGFVEQTLEFFKNINYGILSTVVGRYYAMDRDKNYSRIKIAFEGLVQGNGERCDVSNLVETIKSKYVLDKPETDEFLKPIILNDDGRIRDNDTLVFFDYRSDRMRQIVSSFAVELNFETNSVPKDLNVICMTQYKPEYNLPILFPPIEMKNVLAEWLSVNDVSQLHVAETEKYAHVTFFFNGSVESPFPNENRVLVPSPKVATYDLKPEMSCLEVGDKVVEGINSGKYPFVMCNLAPPDMVGHTGVYEKTILACEATDAAIGNILKACEENDYILVVTADHGNAEKMYDENNNPHTAHTLFPVPLCVTGPYLYIKPNGRNPALCDVAPTILSIMGLPIPKEMQGEVLVKNKS